MRFIYNASQKHQTLVYIFAKTNLFLKFFHCYTQQEICNKKIITDPTRPKRCRYTTLRNISLKKLHRPKEQHWTADQACAYWRECNRGRWTKPTRPASNSSFISITIRSFRPSFTAILKCLKRRLLEKWLKQISMWDSNAQNSCWIFIFIHFSDTTLFTLATLKNS